MNLFGDPALCFEDRAAEIAPTDAELDRDVALLVLAVNE